MIKALAKRAYHLIPLKRQAFELFRGRVKLPSSIYQHLQFRGPFTVTMDDRHSFKMWSYGEILENQLFWNGYGTTFEGVSLRAWRYLAETAKGAILDIGANNGVYALAARAVNDTSKVIAFEPIPRILAKLQRNIELNGFRIESEPLAISDQSGAVPIYDVPTDHNYTASLEATHGDNTTSYFIEATTLDGHLAKRGWPEISLIKLDIETHEPAAIRGMMETLRRFRPTLLIETLTDELGAEIAAQVQEIGYLIFNIDETEGLISAETLRPLGHEKWNNLLCTQEVYEAAHLHRLLAKPD